MFDIELTTVKVMPMAGYTKLFNSILASTIWREDNETRIVWITLLAMANKNGVAETSIPSLADIARVSFKKCVAALEILKSPDKYSRTKEHEGRRIAECDGGFVLLNHAKYRAKMSLDERKEYNRVKQAERRQKIALGVNSVSTNVKLVNDMSNTSMTVNDNSNKSALSAHTDTDTDTDTDSDSKADTEPLPQIRSSATLTQTPKSPTTTEILKAELLKIYRPDGRPMEHLEERTLFELCQSHPKILEEWGRILKYRKGLSENDRKFFPKSIRSLLEKWSGILDQSYQSAKADAAGINRGNNI
jgi:hypothetical protein